MKKIVLVGFLLLSSLIFGKGFKTETSSDATRYIISSGVTESYSQQIVIFDDGEIRLFLSNSGEPSFWGGALQAVVRCLDDNCDCEVSDVKFSKMVVYNSYYDCYVVTGIDEGFINSLKKHNEVYIEIKYMNSDGNWRFANGRFSCKNFTKSFDWLMNNKK